MSHLPARRDEGPVFIQKRVEPAPVPAEIQDKQNKATVGFFRRIWLAVRGYTIEDAQRLKEAGVLIVEGKAGEQIGKARKLDAEAAKLHAEAEAIHQETAINKLQQHQDWLELEEKRVALLERQAAAMERLEKAISVINIKGGATFVDGKQIEQALSTNGQLLGTGTEEIEKND